MKTQARMLSQWIDRLSDISGALSAWLIFLMVMVICYDVAMRYIFNSGSVAMQELEWHLFALSFLLAAGYTLKQDKHVRVDILFHSNKLNDRQRAWINIIGTCLFLVPFCLLIIVSGWDFASNSFFYQEGSPDPGGLPYRFILKGALVLGFVILLLQGIAELIKNILALQQESE